MCEQTLIPFSEARELIEEADVLLFRCIPWGWRDLKKFKFPSIGWIIANYTGGIHSHVGLAHWDGGHLMIVEQREFKGGRCVRLSGQVANFPGRIDVFKAGPSIYHLRSTEGDYSLNWITVPLTAEIRQQITETALQLTGAKYGWWNIWKIVRSYFPFFRLVHKKYDTADKSLAYVCSTVVSNSYKRHYADPCNFINDDMTSPADLARSPLFNFAFTISHLDVDQNV